MAADMVKVQFKPGYFVKVRRAELERYLATYPEAKVMDAQAEDKAEDKAEEAPAEPKPAEADNAPDSAAQAPLDASEEKAVAPAETEDKAVSEPNVFRPRRGVR